MHNVATLPPAYRPHPPLLSPLATRSAMWAVEIAVHGRDHAYTWRGWAADSQDARRLALDEARQTWVGHTFAVKAVYQVGV